jgi:hypothetical protein
MLAMNWDFWSDRGKDWLRSCFKTLSRGNHWT